MTIGKFFIELGIKGADKSKKDLDGAQKGLKGLSSAGLEAKAAILAIFYGLSKLTTHSADLGQALKGFGDLTGLSTDKLQRWQYMSKLAGGTADDMTSSIKNVQNAMTDLVLEGQAPKGLEMLGKVTGGLDPKRFRDTFYMMDKLRDFAQKTKNSPDTSNWVLKSFGLSEGAIQVMRTSKMDMSKIGGNKLFDNGDKDRLSKLKYAWEDLWHKIDIAMGKMAGKEGLPLVRDLSKAADAALRLANALVVIVEKLHLIQGFGHLFDFVAKETNALAGEVGYVTNSKDSALTKTGNVARDTGKNIVDMLPVTQYFRMMQAYMSGGQKSGANMSVNIHNHGVKDAKDANTLNTKAVQEAYRQSPAQTQVK